MATVIKEQCEYCFAFSTSGSSALADAVLIRSGEHASASHVNLHRLDGVILGQVMPSSAGPKGKLEKLA